MHNLNETYTNEYLSYLAQSTRDEADRHAAWDYILNSTAVFDGKPVYMGYVPRLFDQETYNSFKETAETLHSVLCKVIAEYQANPAYRELFSFDARLQQLMLAPTGYESALPIARVDCFFNEDTGDMRFCEFNTDGTSGMNENREGGNCLIESEPYQRFTAHHTVETCDAQLFDEWIDAFLGIYATCDIAVDNPHIALVDFLENAAIEEFKVYARLFEERGYQVSIFDVRELSYDGQRLTGKNAFWGESDTTIDVIWRRTVAADLMAHWDESQALVQAYLDHKVALIGSFATNIVHDKQVFRVLHRPETTALLTDAEAKLVARCIPRTAFLDAAEIDINEVRANPANWVIKPTDGYCSKDVSVGCDFTAEEWNHIIDECLQQQQSLGAHYLVQERCELFKTKTVPLYGSDHDFTDAPVQYNNLTGLYLINGKFGGVFSRLGPGSIILGRKGGVTSASLWVDVERGE